MSHESESEWVRHVWEVNQISEGKRNMSEIVTVLHAGGVLVWWCCHLELSRVYCAHGRGSRK